MGNFQIEDGFFGDVMINYFCGISSIVLGIITSIYGVWFYRNKVKHFEVAETLPIKS
jgi:hypothetical protein